jgi:hypothetical protein
MEKLPGKLENSGKTESAFFLWVFVWDKRNFFLLVIVLEKFSGKDIRDNNKGKSEIRNEMVFVGKDILKTVGPI